MKTKTLGVAATVAAAVALPALMTCAPAAAAPTPVQLRVEGSSSTVFEGPVTTDGKSIDKGGSPHRCNGTNGGINPSPGPTMTSALDDASLAAGFPWAGTWDDGFQDFFLDAIGPDRNDFGAGISWGYARNNQPISLGGCQQQVQPRDEVLFAFDFFGGPPDYAARPLLRLTGPATAASGRPVELTVTNGTDGKPIEGATIAAAPGVQSNPDGKLTATFTSEGLKVLKAERAGAVRSNRLTMCVSPTAADTCGVAPELLGPAGGRAVHDSRAPLARISGPRDGARYRRGPRVLRGTASDDASGVSQVKLSLRRHVRGGCRWWSGRRERFVGKDCRKTFFFAIGDDADWSYLLPRRLPAGRYVLDVKAFDRSRNRDEHFVPGSNRAVFQVLRSRGGDAASSAAAAAGARVQVMVMGRTRLLIAPRIVRAGELELKALGRRCAIAASTPLAALQAALTGSALGVQLRDFGRCSPTDPRASAQLFVDRVGADRNAGQDGWVYKVGNRAGTAGAADAGGPFGNGPLRKLARVLWFYCRLDAATGSCQRTLALSRSRIRGKRRQRTSVTVRSYGNDGLGRLEPGVKLSLGGKTFITDAKGEARLVLPRRGRYDLQASKAGTVPAFPTRVRAR